MLKELPLQRMQDARGREAFDGRDIFALRFDAQHQARTDYAPSTSTLHAPQSPVRHPSLAPVSSTTSRRVSSRL